MSERNVGQEILEGIQEIKKFKKGKVYLRTHTLKTPVPSEKIKVVNVLPPPPV